MAKNKKIKLNFEIDGLKDSVKNIEDLEENLKLLNDELKKTDIGSDNFKDLTNAISKTSSELKNLESSFQGLDVNEKASEFGSFTAGLTETTTGAVALSGALGLTNQSSIEMVETLASGMAIAQSFRGGIQGIISAQKLLRSSTIAQTIATNGGVVAQTILNAVMAANPIMLVVVAITALVAALSIFSISSNNAAKKSEELNNALDEQKRAYDEATLAADRLDKQRQKSLDRNKLILESELNLLKSKKNLTKSESDRIKELENDINQVKFDKLESTIQTTSNKFTDAAGQMTAQFDIMRHSIRATQGADWGSDDLDYQGLIDKNIELSRSFNEVSKAGLNKDNVDEQLIAIQELEKGMGDYVATLERDQKKLGKSAKAQFDQTIESAKGTKEMYSSMIEELTKYKDAVEDTKLNKTLDENSKIAEDIADSNERQNRAEKARSKYLQNEAKIKSEILKIDQALAIAAIDQSDLSGQEEAATLRRQQQLENELAGIEGNSSKAIELRKKLTELAEIEISAIKEDYKKRQTELDKENGEKEALIRFEENQKKIDGQRILTDLNISVMEEGYEKEKAIQMQKFEDDKLLLKMSLDDGLLTQEMYNEAIELAEQEHNNELDRLRKEDTDRAKEEMDVKKSMSLEATEGLLGGILDLTQAFAGESEAAQKKAFKVNKAFQIAQATIDTIKGGISAFTGMVASVPGPVGIVLGAVAAAGVVASGIASIKKIASTKFMGSGGGAAPSIEPPKEAPVPPSVRDYSGDANEGSEGMNEQEIGNRQQNIIVTANVYEGEMTNAQKRTEGYQERRKIG